VITTSVWKVSEMQINGIWNLGRNDYSHEGDQLESGVGYKLRSNGNLEMLHPILDDKQVLKWRRRRRRFHKDTDGCDKRHKNHRSSGSGRLPRNSRCPSAQDGRVPRPRRHGQPWMVVWQSLANSRRQGLSG